MISRISWFRISGGRLLQLNMELQHECKQEAFWMGHCMLPWRLGAHQEGVYAANASTDVTHLGKTLPVSVSLLLRISNCIQAFLDAFPTLFLFLSSCLPWAWWKQPYLRPVLAKTCTLSSLTSLLLSSTMLLLPLLTWHCYPWGKN